MSSGSAWPNRVCEAKRSRARWRSRPRTRPPRTCMAVKCAWPAKASGVRASAVAGWPLRCTTKVEVEEEGTLADMVSWLLEGMDHQVPELSRVDFLRRNE
ncbi:hypothetical protein D3C87_1872850 [compost metagenome]